MSKMTPEKHRQQERERRARRYADNCRIIAAEKNKGCSYCGRIDIPHSELEFDHLDPITKHRKVSRMKWGSSAALEKEIRLTRLVCRIHHQDRHAPVQETYND